MSENHGEKPGSRRCRPRGVGWPYRGDDSDCQDAAARAEWASPAAVGGVVTASAPGRICLAGENLDWMTGGSTAVAAIPLRTRVTAWRQERSPSLVISSGAPFDRSVLVQPADLGTYSGDPLDYLRAAAHVTIMPRRAAGVVLTVSTELPVGAGVSSSAAVTLAAVSALVALTHGARPDPAEACELAHQAETVELRTGAGWMDFLARGYGGVNEEVAAAAPRVRPLASVLGTPVVLVDTLVRRATKAVLASERERFRAGESSLIAYVEATTAIVDELAAALRRPGVDYARVGQLVTEAHAQLRDRMGRSSELVEACVDAILQAGGYGAKLSGTGGCVFGLVAPNALDAVLAALASLPVRALPFAATEPKGVRIHLRGRTASTDLSACRHCVRE